MEASVAEDIPAGGDWQYEPKWDGFRCLAFRDHDEIELQSKAGKSLTRYFPELVASLAGLSMPLHRLRSACERARRGAGFARCADRSTA